MHRFFSSRALAIAGVSLVAVVGGVVLAWWQWTRYESASGTLQNLGYVLQWPLFGVFPGFMFWRIRRSALQERELDRTPPAAGGPPSTVDTKLTYAQNRTVTYVAEEDQELLAYNHYLAQLADREQHHAG